MSRLLLGVDNGTYSSKGMLVDHPAGLKQSAIANHPSKLRLDQVWKALTLRSLSNTHA